MKILITGAAGFIFSNFIRLCHKRYPEHQFVGLDKLVKEYNIDNIYSNCPFYVADIADHHTIDRIFKMEKFDIVIGGAAESFVDNSITNVMPFLHTNVIGTQVLIDACLKYNVEKYIHISTDEIYGQQMSMDAAPWREEAPVNPRNPYAASKACAEHVVIAAHNTHNLQYQMTRSCNVFGARQKAENLIPHIITSLHNGSPIRLHGSGLNFRQYIYVEDEINAIMTILNRGQINQTYNIGDNNYYTNLEMVNNIATLMNKQPIITHITDRKAHDFGYSVNSNKLINLGWTPKNNFTSHLQQTIDYYTKDR